MRYPRRDRRPVCSVVTGARDVPDGGGLTDEAPGRTFGLSDGRIYPGNPPTSAVSQWPVIVDPDAPAQIACGFKVDDRGYPQKVHQLKSEVE